MGATEMPLPQLQFLDVGRAMESGRRNALADLQMAETMRQMKGQNALREAMRASVQMTPGPVQVPTGYDQSRFVTEAMQRGAPMESILPMLQQQQTQNALRQLLAGGAKGGTTGLSPEAIVQFGASVPGGSKFTPDLWKMYEANNPKLENVPGVGMVDPRTGIPRTYLPKITDTGRAAGVRFDENGQPVTYVPRGSLEAFSAFQNADEAAKAQFRFNPVQPADPSQPPRMVSDFERARASAGAPPNVPPITGGGYVGEGGIRTPAPQIAPVMGADGKPISHGNSGTRHRQGTAQQAGVLLAEAQAQIAEKGTLDPALQRELTRYGLTVPSAPATSQAPAFDPLAAGPSPQAKARADAAAAGAKEEATGRAKTLTEREADLPKAKLRAVKFLDKLDAALKLIDETREDPALGKVIGPLDAVTPDVMPSSARAAAKVERLQNIAKLLTLQDVRDMSQTGGAGGQITEREWPIFQDQIAALKRAQTEESFALALNDAEETLKRWASYTRKDYESQHGKLDWTPRAGTKAWARDVQSSGAPSKGITFLGFEK